MKTGKAILAALIVTAILSGCGDEAQIADVKREISYSVESIAESVPESPEESSEESSDSAARYSRAETVSADWATMAAADEFLYDTDESTCFSQIGYDYAKERLYVVFRNSGAYYVYLDVPEHEFEELQSATSKGGYYNQRIKGQYECVRIEN